MKRYYITECYRLQESLVMNEDENGDFVKYEDVVNIVSKLVPYHETKAAKDVAERYLKKN